MTDNIELGLFMLVSIILYNTLYFLSDVGFGQRDKSNKKTVLAVGIIFYCRSFFLFFLSPQDRRDGSTDREPF